MTLGKPLVLNKVQNAGKSQAPVNVFDLAMLKDVVWAAIPLEIVGPPTDMLLYARSTSRKLSHDSHQ